MSKQKEVWVGHESATLRSQGNKIYNFRLNKKMNFKKSKEKLFIAWHN